MRSEQVVVDPIAVQRADMAGLAATELELDELCNPSSVRLIIGQTMTNLAQLEALEQVLADLRTENKGLMETREELRVAIAKSAERDLVSWIEIPAGFLLGIAATMLADPGTQPLAVGMGLALMAILLFLRMSGISDMVSRARGRGRKESLDA